ncbi:hypothetical protein C9426_05575 [Serratia sp. S1B]|nr:hypothetical protein C9426_05575 [Serratia sp. S1B]
MNIKWYYRQIKIVRFAGSGAVNIVITLYILVILQVAWVLAAFARTSHIVIYAPGDSRTGRLHATRII